MSIMNSVIATFDTHDQAELAITELQEDGIDMKSISIAGKNTHTDEHVVGYYNCYISNLIQRGTLECESDTVRVLTPVRFTEFDSMPFQPCFGQMLLQAKGTHLGSLIEIETSSIHLLQEVQ